jgi:D-alanyl-D-alanine carboxypeptidase (penicillin-binding protein 5/6)
MTRARTLLLFLVLGLAAVSVLAFRGRDSTHDYLARDGWPTTGQASYQIGTGRMHSSADQRPVPIASVAKVMTAYLTLHRTPLDAPFLTVTAADVADTTRRRAGDESVVAVAAGEHLTRRQALQALLLPSANNIAIMIARRLSGTVPAFVALMNRTAKALGLWHTHYTDPSGLDAATVSTAADQVRLADLAMAHDDFLEIVGTPWADLPVAGRVRSTDSLLGTAGFVGIKTGSTDAAGGCFVFRTYRNVHGTIKAVTGAVLAQPGDDAISAALTAARQLADRIA